MPHPLPFPPVRLDLAVVRVDEARDLARELLKDLPERWAHTVGVAEYAERLIPVIGDDDPELLVSAAWLHDIGYSAALVDTGFHPVDGARHLRARRCPHRLTGLVAHHSGACFVAQARGLADALAEFPREESALADALTYADQSVGPHGKRMSVGDRIADMLRRHGPASTHAAVQQARGPHLLAVAARVEGRLASLHPAVGLTTF